jgi:SAM-dependent methyltransferase
LPARLSGTQGYAEEAETLLSGYEGVSFARLHADILKLLPPAPARVLDIGAGSGRDAGAFAERGYQVVAVEPTGELREPGRVLHPSPHIEWIDDGLPDLATLAGLAAAFDVVMLTAVWMHLDAQERQRAMPVVTRLLRSGGVLSLSLRHGPVPAGRRMFEVTAEETVALAEAEGLRILLRAERQDGYFKRPGVSWTRLAFAKEEPPASR